MMMILLVCYNNTFKSRHRAAFGLGFVLFCTSMVSGYLLHQVIFLLIAVRPTVFLIFFPIYKYKRPHDQGLAAVSTIFPQDDLAAWVSWLRFPSPQYWAAHPILERELGPVIVIIVIISTSLFFTPGFKSHPCHSKVGTLLCHFNPMITDTAVGRDILRKVTITGLLNVDAICISSICFLR